MTRLRPAHERGHANHGWLDTYHTFSFAGYHDANHMGFRDLRVINEDRVSPGGGFGAHGHRDMEILTYVLEGALEHRDSLGSVSVLRPGNVQHISAGKGITHSEYNASRTEPVHFLQIWILPEQEGLVPGYEERTLPAEERQGKWQLIAARDGREGAVTVRQDVNLYTALLSPGVGLTYPMAPGRHAWVQLGRGLIRMNGYLLQPGDGAAISEEEMIHTSAEEPAEVLLFDLR